MALVRGPDSQHVRGMEQVAVLASQQAEHKSYQLSIGSGPEDDSTVLGEDVQEVSRHHPGGIRAPYPGLQIFEGLHVLDAGKLPYLDLCGLDLDGRRFDDLAPPSPEFPCPALLSYASPVLHYPTDLFAECTSDEMTKMGGIYVKTIHDAWYAVGGPEAATQLSPSSCS